MLEQEQRIRQRAYEIWEREGCPHGREDEHWHRAVQEIEAQARSAAPVAAAAVAPPAPRRDRRATQPGAAIKAPEAVSKPRRSGSKAAADAEPGGATAHGRRKAPDRAGRSKAKSVPVT